MRPKDDDDDGDEEDGREDNEVVFAGGLCLPLVLLRIYNCLFAQSVEHCLCACGGREVCGCALSVKD